MLIDIPLDVLERAVDAFGCVQDECATQAVEDQAKADAALLRKKIDDSVHAANFAAMFDGEGDESV